jgi:hypothetical protein
MNPNICKQFVAPRHEPCSPALGDSARQVAARRAREMYALEFEKVTTS